jgi:hypothetical protein
MPKPARFSPARWRLTRNRQKDRNVQNAAADAPVPHPPVGCLTISRLSKTIVTGPSLHSDTSIIAWN